jgi:hypothetical protein
VSSAAVESGTGIAQRLRAITHIEGAARSITPPVPKSARVEISGACDLHCFFCASHKHPREPAEMSPELYMRLARELRDAGVEQLGLFHIGESFLCEWLPDAIRYAKDVCGYPYVFLTTNGVSATPERVRSALLAGLDSLKFALNWADPWQFQAVTRAPAAEFESVLRNLEAARSIRDDVRHETGHRCALYASSLCYDGEQRTRMAAVLRDVEPCVDQHYWLPLLGHWGLPDARQAGRPVPVKELPCWPLFTEAHITRDGKLSACGLDASSRFHMADLTTTAFVEAWHSTAFQTLRAAHLSDRTSGTVCQHCVAYAER